MTGPTALVVGAEGFVGSATTRKLLAAGMKVATFGPRVPNVDLLADIRSELTTTEGSVLDQQSLTAVLQQVKPAVVFSFAAFGSGGAGLMRSAHDHQQDALAVNVAGLEVLLRCCIQSGVPRVVWASSTTVFGPWPVYGEGRVDEAAPRAPSTFYGLTKVMAEDLTVFLRSHQGLQATAVRVPLVVGPGRWYGGAAAELDRLLNLNDESATGALSLTTSTQPFDLIHIDDAASAFAMVGELPDTDRAWVHANGFTTSWDELVAAARERFPALTIATTDDDQPEAAYPLIDDRYLRGLGYRPGHSLNSLFPDRRDIA